MTKKKERAQRLEAYRTCDQLSAKPLAIRGTSYSANALNVERCSVASTPTEVSRIALITK